MYRLPKGLIPEDIQKALDELEVKAMLFDMDIDIETWSLVPKRKDETLRWLKKLKAKQEASDNDPASPEQAWA